MSHRLFLCGRCRRLVELCSRCDRGNHYCSPECAAAQRRDSVRRAAKIYQRTQRGAEKHAERQRRYRARQRIVTHQGCTRSRIRSSLAARTLCLSSLTRLDDAGSTPRPYHYACASCGRTNDSKWHRCYFLRSREHPG